MTEQRVSFVDRFRNLVRPAATLAATAAIAGACSTGIGTETPKVTASPMQSGTVEPSNSPVPPSQTAFETQLVTESPAVPTATATTIEPSATIAPTPTEIPSPTPSSTPEATKALAKCAEILATAPATEADTTTGRMTDAITEANILLGKGKKVTYAEYKAAVLALYDPKCQTYNPDMEANYSLADMTNLLNIIQTSTDVRAAPSDISATLVAMSQIPGNYTTAVLTYMFGKLEQPSQKGADFVHIVASWIDSN